MINRLVAEPLRFVLSIGRREKQSLSILIYHRVLTTPDYLRPNEPDAAAFNWQMELLARYFQPLSLESAVKKLSEGLLPENAVCVTFDDGYADNLTVAQPILQRWNIPFTVFVATAYLNGGRMWNDTILEAMRLIESGATIDLSAFGMEPFSVDERDNRVSAARKIIANAKYLSQDQRQALADTLAERVKGLPDDLMLTAGQVRELYEAGATIGAHTHSHPILKLLSCEQAREEIMQNQSELESIIQDTVTLFAYPNGCPGKDYSPEHRDLVEQMGFIAAVSTANGVSSKASDRFQLSRFTPWDQAPLTFYLRLLLNQRNLA